ncbi:hypothetical protein [Nocardia asteroides]|uniref:hypothetical protein n=1 Tax=Nocardia asteroides TaxID=1824 RepID=UPI001E4E2D96|nr:hypothetical protein [Nocardia asteroides]UGT58930.1 hypothetical protein LTT85_33120 [Nocardia asteroides]
MTEPMRSNVHAAASTAATGTSAALADAIAAQVTMLLTEVSRLDRPGPDAGSVPEPLDFADFLVRVLTAVAANRGGTAHLLAATPDSWQTRALDDLLTQAGCGITQVLAAARTAPIVIEVPLAHILDDAGDDEPDPDHPGQTRWRSHLPADESLNEHTEALLARRAAAFAALAERPLVEHAAETARLDQEYDTAYQLLRRRWRGRLEAYLTAFRAAVVDRAREMGLQVPIEVRGETDIERAWTAATDVADLYESGDALAAELYEYGLTVTPIDLLGQDAPGSVS